MEPGTGGKIVALAKLCHSAVKLGMDAETAFEAAAASLPLITPLLHGIEEIVIDGQTGYIVRRTVEDFAAALTRFVQLSVAVRTEMGRRARAQAAKYNEESFVANWRCFYNDGVTDDTRAGSPAPAAAI